MTNMETVKAYAARLGISDSQVIDNIITDYRARMAAGGWESIDHGEMLQAFQPEGLTGDELYVYLTTIYRRQIRVRSTTEQLTTDIAPSREALDTSLHFDATVEGVILGYMQCLGRTRGDIIESVLIKTIAEEMAKTVARPDIPLVLTWAAIGADNEPLRGQALYDMLHKRFVALLRSETPPEINVRMLSIGPAKVAVPLDEAVAPVSVEEEARK